MIPKNISNQNNVMPQRPILPCIDTSSIDKALETLQKYRSGKKTFNDKCKKNEQIYRQQFEFKNSKKGSDFATHSAWLLNAINNKHADAIDNTPSPEILPREISDKETAKVLRSALPVILERNRYDDTYSDKWYTKLKFGMSLESITWDSRIDDGIGDIKIKNVDVLSCDWDPNVKDIQDSKNFFYSELCDNDVLIAQFPQLQDLLNKTPTISYDTFDQNEEIDNSNKTLVTNWYYKRAYGNRIVLHYCKFCNRTILFASENKTEYIEHGYYWHGKYPFVQDVMYPQENTSFAYGLIDIGTESQKYIDLLQGAIIKNALQSSKIRKLIREDGQINIDQYMDYENDIVTYKGNLDKDSIIDLTSAPLPSIYVNILDSKINELKETTNNRDFSQGGTSSGVTAASAIAALQEAGSKTSRDNNKGSYRAYKDMCYMAIELIRQFYDTPRTLRISQPNGDYQYMQFDNRLLTPDGTGGRLPVFDIVIKAQRSSPYSTMAQNELAKELYGAGMFNPQMADQAIICLDMMDFEGKDGIINKVSQNSQLLAAITQLQQQCAQLAAIVDSQNGSSILAGMQLNPATSNQATQTNKLETANIHTDTLGRTYQSNSGSQSDKTTARANVSASPA